MQHPLGLWGDTGQQLLPAGQQWPPAGEASAQQRGFPCVQHAPPGATAAGQQFGLLAGQKPEMPSLELLQHLDPSGCASPLEMQHTGAAGFWNTLCRFPRGDSKPHRQNKLLVP